MEELRYKISVDANELQQTQQQMNLMAQQQAMMISQRAGYQGQGMDSFYQQQAMASALAMGNYGGLDPRRAFAEESYSSSIQKMSQNSMAGLYGSPNMNPYLYNQPYNYPTGFIPGKPDFPQYSGSMKTSLGNLAGAMLFPGMQGIGSRIDQPIYRQMQSLTEIPMRQIADMGINTVNNTVKLAGIATQAFAYSKLGLGGAAVINPAMLMVGKAADYTATGVKDYMDMGEYFRDATAPYIRSERLGGGPSSSQVSQFQRNMGRIVADDKILTRQDYAGIEKLAVDQGYFQTTNTVEKATKVIENLGKNMKALYALGGKVSDTMKIAEQLNQVGINLAGGGSESSRFMAMLSTSAFQAGTTMSQLMPGVAQAGQLSAMIGLAPSVGALTHMKSQAMAGEGIRSGAFSQEDLAYYGGRQGIAESTTRAFSNLNRSPIGQMMSMAFMANPNQAGKFGNMSMGDVMKMTNQFGNADNYYGMQRNMPELSRMLSGDNPDAFGVNMMSSYTKMIKDSLGGKVSLNQMYGILTSPNGLGLSAQDAGAWIKQLENASKTREGANESIANKLQQVDLERLRTQFSILRPSTWGNKIEELTEKPISNISAGITGAIGHASEALEEYIIHNTSGKTVVKSKPKTQQEKIDDLLGATDQMKNNKRLSELYKEKANSYMTPFSLFDNMYAKTNENEDKFINEIKLSKTGNTKDVISKNEFNNILKDISLYGTNNLSDENQDKLKNYYGSLNSNKEKENTLDLIRGVLPDKSSSLDIVQALKKGESARGSLVSGFNSSNELFGKSAEFYNKNKAKDFLLDVTTGYGPLDFQQDLETKYAKFLKKSNGSELSDNERNDLGMITRDMLKDYEKSDSLENKDKEKIKEIKDHFSKLDKTFNPQLDVRKDLKAKLDEYEVGFNPFKNANYMLGRQVDPKFGYKAVINTKFSKGRYDVPVEELDYINALALEDEKKIGNSKLEDKIKIELNNKFKGLSPYEKSYLKTDAEKKDNYVNTLKYFEDVNSDIVTTEMSGMMGRLTGLTGDRLTQMRNNILDSEGNEGASKKIFDSIQSHQDKNGGSLVGDLAELGTTLIDKNGKIIDLQSNPKLKASMKNKYMNAIGNRTKAFGTVDSNGKKVQTEQEAENEKKASGLFDQYAGTNQFDDILLQQITSYTKQGGAVTPGGTASGNYDVGGTLASLKESIEKQGDTFIAMQNLAKEFTDSESNFIKNMKEAIATGTSKVNVTVNGLEPYETSTSEGKALKFKEVK